MPTALDRLLQQALLQVLTPVFDPHFHFGFRPGRSAHQAVERARQSIADGAAWVVDVDLDAFEDGTPQDSPLSPLLANVMLDDLDWELEPSHRLAWAG